MLRCIKEDVCVPLCEVCDHKLNCIHSVDDEYLCDIPSCPSKCSCYELVMSCHEEGLYDLPVYYRYIKGIDVANNKLSKVLPIKFYPYLMHFDLSHNFFQNLKENRFIANDHIIRVDFSYNRIHGIAGNSFIGLKYVTEIYLIRNRIQSIAQYGFHG